MGGNAFHHLVHRYLRLENEGFRKYPESRIEPCKDGDIVLMHDLYKATATASQTIIPELTRRGYQLVTVSELAECRGGMKQNKSYSKFPKKQK